DPGTAGFFVYMADVGTQTFAGPGGPPNQLFDITSLPLASYIVGFVDLGASGIEATANRGAIFVTVPGLNEGPEPSRLALLGPAPGLNEGPEPSALALLGAALAGLGFVLWRRRRVA